LLHVEIISANAPRRRVVSSVQTASCRIGSWRRSRLAGISIIEDGNALMPAFLENYNRRFAEEPLSDKYLHRPQGRASAVKGLMTGDNREGEVSLPHHGVGADHPGIAPERVGEALVRVAPGAR